MRRGPHMPFRTLTALMFALTVGTIASFGNASIARAVSIECAPATPAAAVMTSPAAAVTPEAAAEFPEGGGELTVFAAASLTDAFEQMKSDLESAHSGLTITYNFAGSQ